MDASALFFLLFLVPCLLMVGMMLRGHGHGGHSHGGVGGGHDHSRVDEEPQPPQDTR